ncbi:MAG: hypothetical protein KGJ06_02480 [Pseudomonadota bacterium]|nr:hypothetical protein [Pseudomonadota bacterium]
MSTTVNTIASAASAAASSVSGSNAVSQAAAATTNAGAMQTEFLKLLTTQLQNQDPTAPADTNQITQEMAQLGMVEQQTNTNTLLQQLINLLNSNQTSNAVSYIGKNVDSTGNQLQLTGGQATFAYSLPAGASSALVTVTTPAGQTVFSGSGTTIAGRNQVIWDGTNSTTGQTMPDGTYNFTVTAKDANGNALTPTTFTSGTVTAVDNSQSGTTLSIGTMSVPLSGVHAVYNPGTNPG